MSLHVPEIRVDFQPGCPRPECPCHLPGRPCDEFMGIDESRGWCPRCGWHQRHHFEARPRPLVVDGHAYHRRARRRRR